MERWRRLRGWALEGHDATLAALGVTLDREVHESDSRPLTRWILDAGLANGVLTRTDSGAVVYETGEDEYPRLLLARPDGFPTQHLRTFALWHSLRASLDGTRSVELVGEEWHAYVRYHERLMQGIAPSQAPRQPQQQRDLRDGHRGGRRGEVEQRPAAARGRAAGAARRLPGAGGARRAERGTLQAAGPRGADRARASTSAAPPASRSTSR